MIFTIYDRRMLTKQGYTVEVRPCLLEGVCVFNGNAESVVAVVLSWNIRCCCSVSNDKLMKL